MFGSQAKALSYHLTAIGSWSLRYSLWISPQKKAASSILSLVGFLAIERRQAVSALVHQFRALLEHRVGGGDGLDRAQVTGGDLGAEQITEGLNPLHAAQFGFGPAALLFVAVAAVVAVQRSQGAVVHGPVHQQLLDQVHFGRFGDLDVGQLDALG